MRQEILRKLLHLASLWIPILYSVTEKGTMLIIMILATILVAGIELGRHHLSPLETLFQSLFGPVLRQEEKTRARLFTGSTPLMLASTLTIALFAKPTALAALYILMISDTAAALIGKAWGRHPFQGKSWEGTGAFAASAFIICLCMDFSFFASLFTALLTAAAELYSKRFKIDDNFSIPLIAGLALTLLA